MIKLEGFDDCIAGVTHGAEGGVFVYDVASIIDKLKDQGMAAEDAWEHFEFNIAQGCPGPTAPVFVYDDCAYLLEI